MKQYLLLFIALVMVFRAYTQFAPPAGMPGSTAIYKDSSCFVAWANQCTLHRGWMYIGDTTLGKAIVGDSSSAIGKAGENGVASLGDGGIAVLQFQYPIYNGPGFDFAIFENAFRDDFLEFAFVEVSSDGLLYRRFPATTFIDTLIQSDSFGLSDCSKVNNLAGKYRALYGTPFDLNELAIYSDIDIMNITHVRIIDVVGSLHSSFATYDQNGVKINDPFPTPYPSCGFDIDALGIIHAKGYTAIPNQTVENVFSLTAEVGIPFTLPIDKINQVMLYDMMGKETAFTYENNKMIVFEQAKRGLHVAIVFDGKNWFQYKIWIN